MGQNINDMDAFDDSGLTRVNSDDEDGFIDEKVVEQLHFGGFDPKDPSDPNSKKSRNEIMKEVIAKSKMHKRERQQQKEHDLDLVEQVDEELELMRSLLAPMNPPTSQGIMKISSDRLQMINGEIPRTAEKKAKSEDKNEDVGFQETPELNNCIKDDVEYDRYVHELAYDRRSKPTDRTKTEEELALEEAERLRKLESERVSRMNGVKISEQADIQKKRIKTEGPVADDLEFNHFDTEEEVQPLTYKDGVLVNKHIFMKPAANDDSEEGDNSEESEEENDEEENSYEESDSDNDTSKSLSGVKTSVSDNEALSDTTETQNALYVNEDVAFDSEEDLKYIQDTADLSESEDLPQEPQFDSYSENSELPQYDDDLEADSGGIEDLKKELPYTFEAPETYKDLIALFEGWSRENILIIIQRIIILHNPKLGPDAREKLEIFMKLLLRHYEAVSFELPIEDMEYIRGIESHLISLCRQFPAAFALYSKEKITILRNSFNKSLLSSKLKPRMPSFSTLLLFKLIGHVFSTSDLFHLVVSPTMILIAQFLSQACVASYQDMYSGLFLCEIIFEVCENT